ncbi:hypothetical protein [Virgibacillus sp. L01]|uniref:hypothetical protein n=1 Tax=Virgibacillus sp. L01 TaxID=3457429 RepID=UPI003FD49D19
MESLKKHVQKQYKGDLTFFKSAQENYERICFFSDLQKDLDEVDSFGEGSMKSMELLDGVNTLKNVMAFAEVKGYKKKPFYGIPKRKKGEAVRSIIKDLDKCDIKPVAYEVRRESIIFVWFQNLVIHKFPFSEDD